jgi:transposase
MSGKPSADMERVMHLVTNEGMSPYAAAKQVNVALSTVYRSPLYKAYKAEQAKKPNQKEKR